MCLCVCVCACVWLCVRLRMAVCARVLVACPPSLFGWYPHAVVAPCLDDRHSQPPVFWKHLAREPPCEADLEDFDLATAQILGRLQAVQRQGSVDIDSFVDVFDSTFTVALSDKRVVELVPGGGSRRVQLADCLQFCDLALHARLHESVVQIAAIRRGLHSIVPPGALALFTPSELEDLVCGHVHVDLGLLRRMTEYVACLALCRSRGILM